MRFVLCLRFLLQLVLGWAFQRIDPTGILRSISVHNLQSFRKYDVAATVSSRKTFFPPLFDAVAERNDDTSLGGPNDRPPVNGAYVSVGGINVDFKVEEVPDAALALSNMVDKIDDCIGVLLTSSYEYPGRYKRWSVGFVAPALQIEGRGFDFVVKPLNDRGVVLAACIKMHLMKSTELFNIKASIAGDTNGAIRGSVIPSTRYFAEEERSKQPSLFSLIRAIQELFSSPDAGQLGLYGALGYDLTFQFEPIKLSAERDTEARDLVMFLPDEIMVVDNQKKAAWNIKYEFTGGTDTADKHLTTVGVPRVEAKSPFVMADSNTKFEPRDGIRGKYAESVVLAKEEFRVGNLFEVVLSQAFRELLKVKPSTIFRRLCQRNPSPYGFFMNLGSNEYLVGASPEMFVRVENTPKGMRVETCPISGTIERGSDPLEDAQQIKKLLTNAKEESELTMCTDVDRNDKSRICVPGTVKVLGRRQIEMYSRLIHTVDHVEGYLRKGFDALDAFLCHTWAVTVTGAPKTWAIRFIEKMEKSPRHWYGGAVGMIGFDGTLNTGLTLRTIRVHKGIAEVRAGATLLHDSDPAAEEAETELKASALIDAIVRGDKSATSTSPTSESQRDSNKEVGSVGVPRQVLLIDHEDSFVHTLANYLRQTGAEVVTCRSGPPLAAFIAENMDISAKGTNPKFRPDLVVLSPGPGSPSDFHLSETIQSMIDRKIPIFGVCLGLQGLVEYFGGELGVLGYPMHGKPSVISRAFDDKELAPHSSIVQKQQTVYDGPVSFDVLRGLPKEFQVARYHSLHGKRPSLPKELMVTATSPDDVVMAIQHTSMPIAAVQFHPESILTLPKNGMKILLNALETLRSEHYTKTD